MSVACACVRACVCVRVLACVRLAPGGEWHMAYSLVPVSHGHPRHIHTHTHSHVDRASLCDWAGTRSFHSTETRL